MDEEKHDRISGQFVWYAGYLFFKFDGKPIDMETIRITSPEPGTENFHREIQIGVLELGFLSPRTIPELPEDLKDYEVVYRMHPETLSVPMDLSSLNHLFGFALSKPPNDPPQP